MDGSEFNLLKIYLNNVSNRLLFISTDLMVTIVSNLKNKTINSEDFTDFSLETEYFSENELEDIVIALRENNIFVQIFTDEMDFIESHISKKDNNFSRRHKIIYNTAQRGMGAGRKSLIPSFCNLNNIPFVGSNAYVVSLCRHKYHYNLILKQLGLQQLKFWLFQPKIGWLNSLEPPVGLKVIMKPVYESASIGIDNNSITYVTEELGEFINETMRSLNQPIIVQEFIEGYEAEVPVIIDSNKIYTFNPVGISINKNRLLEDRILTYKDVFNDSYQFYQFNELSNKINEEIIKCAGKCAEILGMEGFARIDFRVTKEGKYYISDVSTSPHIIRHSSYAFSFYNLGFEYATLPVMLIGVAAKKYHWI